MTDMAASLPAWVPPLAAALIGYPLGLWFFGALQTVAERLMRGQMSAVLLQLARIAVLVAVFWGFVQFGAASLLAGAGAVLLAKSRVLARARAA